MRRIRQISWFFVVLASAASTLFANVPLTVCACSPPPVSSNSPSAQAESKSSGCPCGMNCCASAPERTACCVKKPGGTTNESKPIEKRGGREHQGQSDGPHLRAPDCQKTVSQRESFSIENRHTNAGELMENVLMASPNSELCCPIPGECDSFGDPVHWEPPPTDLVVSLHHLII